MELKQAQLLVHDDVVLKKFKANHSIPAYVKIERPGLNENANLVERVTMTTFRLGTTVSTRSREKNGRLLENFSDQFKGRSKKCKDFIQAVNNRQGSRKVTNILMYELVYRYVIPHKAKELGSEGSYFLPCTSRAMLCSATPLARRVQEPSSTQTSYKLKLGKKEKESGAPLAKLEAFAAPISNSNNEHSNDLASVPFQLAGEVEIAHSFREGCDTDVTSSKRNMGRFRTLGQKKFAPTTNPLAIASSPISQGSLPALDSILALSTQAGVKLSLSEAPLKLKGRELVAGHSKKSKKKFGPCVVMMPKDVIDLTKEGSEEIRELLVMQQRAFAISEWMKEQSTEIKKSKKKISYLEKQVRLDSQAAEKAREIGIPPKHPAWKAVPPAVEPMDPRQVYSLLMLPDFNEKEMLEENVVEILEKSLEVVSKHG
ncbi:hypothetical protein Acr_07g0011300 [Actinidia rufa]|uniref:Uncharacterized protein n=1 Tax=Actinidia rufa TaxID=165716 RepID=A0A7J0EWT0_9ERIC|nr:hypothetical protein Acr_07g0011300 [Actinidia rufa]